MDWQLMTLLLCAVLTLMNSWIIQPVLSKTSKSVSSSLDLQVNSSVIIVFSLTFFSLLQQVSEFSSLCFDTANINKLR